MSVFSNIYFLFSNYVNNDEKKVGKYFSKLNDKQSKQQTAEKLATLVQDNIVALNLWSERKYKGYKYLTKRKRKKLYENTQFIKNDFETFKSNSSIKLEDIERELANLEINRQQVFANPKKIIYIRQIMGYFSPHNGKYKYRESCTFGELLKDPSKEHLIGDCNQIVTLYIYFYSLKFDVNDLNIKTYPGHVCLHFNGVDIEATNGTFKNYNKEKQDILPVHEIVSVNLLDTTDKYFKTHKVPPEAFLEAAKLAYLTSSNREIVNKNLQIAYSNTVINQMGLNNYDNAYKYAKQSQKLDLIQTVGQNGAVHFIKNKKFSNARKSAQYSKNKQDLLDTIDYNEGITYYNQKKYHAAIKIFSRINQTGLIKQCYAGLFSEEQKKLGTIRTHADLKENKKIINNMHNYAKKSEQKNLIEYTSKLKKQL